MLLIEGPHPTSMTIGSSTSGSKLGTVKNTLRTCSQRGGQRGQDRRAQKINVITLKTESIFFSRSLKKKSTTPFAVILNIFTAPARSHSRGVALQTLSSLA